MEWKEINNENENELSFVSYTEIRKEEGEFHFSFTSASHNENAGANHDSECITLIDNERDTAVTFWCSPHPDSLQQDPSKTDGAKVGNSLRRAFGGSDWAEVIANAGSGGKLSITKNDYPASPTGWAWLFTVKAQSFKYLMS